MTKKSPRRTQVIPWVGPYLPQKERNQAAPCWAALFACLLALACFLPTLIENRGQFYLTNDFNEQQIPFNIYVNASLKEAIRAHFSPTGEAIRAHFAPTDKAQEDSISAGGTQQSLASDSLASQPSPPTPSSPATPPTSSPSASLIGRRTVDTKTYLAEHPPRPPHPGAQWAYDFDLGSPLVGQFAFYNLGSPFFWLYFLFPPESFYYLSAILLILKYSLAAFSASRYASLFFRKGKWIILTGLLYAFSAFQTVNLVFNHFHEVVALFPFLLIALEKLLREGKRVQFLGVAALCCLCNYFFFVSEIVFLAIYFLIRFILPSFLGPQRISLKTYGRAFLAQVRTIALEGLLGILLAGILLVPAYANVKGNPRVSEGDEVPLVWERSDRLYMAKSFFLPADTPWRETTYYKSYWNSIAYALPFFGALAWLTYLLAGSWNFLRGILVVSGVFALFPKLNALFYLNQAYDYRRWYFMPILFASLATAALMRGLEAGSLRLWPAPKSRSRQLPPDPLPKESVTNPPQAFSQHKRPARRRGAWVQSHALLLAVGIMGLILCGYFQEKKKFIDDIPREDRVDHYFAINPKPEKKPTGTRELASDSPNSGAESASYASDLRNPASEAFDPQDPDPKGLCQLRNQALFGFFGTLSLLIALQVLHDLRQPAPTPVQKGAGSAHAPTLVQKGTGSAPAPTPILSSVTATGLSIAIILGNWTYIDRAHMVYNDERNGPFTLRAEASFLLDQLPADAQAYRFYQTWLPRNIGCLSGLCDLRAFTSTVDGPLFAYHRYFGRYRTVHSDYKNPAESTLLGERFYLSSYPAYSTLQAHKDLILRAVLLYNPTTPWDSQLTLLTNTPWLSLSSSFPPLLSSASRTPASTPASSSPFSLAQATSKAMEEEVHAACASGQSAIYLYERTKALPLGFLYRRYSLVDDVQDVMMFHVEHLPTGQGKYEAYRTSNKALSFLASLPIAQKDLDRAAAYGERCLPTDLLTQPAEPDTIVDHDNPDDSASPAEPAEPWATWVDETEKTNENDKEQEVDWEGQVKKIQDFLVDRHLQDAQAHNWRRDSQGLHFTIDVGNRPGLYFLSIPASRGWHCKIDGEEEEIFTVAGLMAVGLSPGSHQVDFLFKDPFLALGLKVTALALILTALYGGLVLLFKRPSTPSTQSTSSSPSSPSTPSTQFISSSPSSPSTPSIPSRKELS